MTVDKIIYQTARLQCDSNEALKMFTVNRHLERWLTMEADVEPRVGGKYELFWNPRDKQNDSTIGCRILAIRPSKFLCFEWKGPKQFKHFMNERRPLTTVAAFFMPSGEGTEVHLLHTGWGCTREWEGARVWFEKAWANALAELQKYVNKK
jgi:uncharacterized protein YndB with AHSA1/START domain